MQAFDVGCQVGELAASIFVQPCDVASWWIQSEHLEGDVLSRQAILVRLELQLVAGRAFDEQRETLFSGLAANEMA